MKSSERARTQRNVSKSHGNVFAICCGCLCCSSAAASAAAAVDACGLRAKIAAGFKWIALARQAEMKANKVHKQVARGAEKEEGEGEGRGGTDITTAIAQAQWPASCSAAKEMSERKKGRERESGRGRGSGKRLV